MTIRRRASMIDMSTWFISSLSLFLDVRCGNSFLKVPSHYLPSLMCWTANLTSPSSLTYQSEPLWEISICWSRGRFSSWIYITSYDFYHQSINQSSSWYDLHHQSNSFPLSNLFKYGLIEFHIHAVSDWTGGSRQFQYCTRLHLEYLIIEHKSMGCIRPCTMGITNSKRGWS